MIYTEFINKAFDETIVQADNGLWYLEPLWRTILHDNRLDIKSISGVKTNLDIIYNVLQLEVEKRNTINSKKPAVLDWLYEIITAQIEPAMLQEETEYIKQVTEFMKANHEAQNLDEQKEWDNFKNT